MYLLNVLKNKEINKFCYNTVLNIAKGIDSSVGNIETAIEILIKDGLLDLLSNKCLYYYETNKYVLTHAFIP